MVSVGSKFYVFGGGLSGPDPVPDTTVHVFNAGEIYVVVQFYSWFNLYFAFYFIISNIHGLITHG